ncbi:MAG: glycoside hydrolase [Acidobacteria bacterium]|nr:glycoside hydrolase [Acidobacteriota bacterium]
MNNIVPSVPRVVGRAIIATVAGIALAASVAALGQDAADTLVQGFQNPPNGARPRVWWHWMNGNITKEGINLDLEWMKRVGLGGFQNFDAALSTPQVVQTRLVYMTPAWKDAFLFATTKADALGLEEAIAGSPGWSETGGPWVEPSQGMKKFVWSTTRVEGGKPFADVLAKPPAVTGPFQNVPLGDSKASHSTNGVAAAAPPEFYADTAVVAYRVPEAAESAQMQRAVVTSSSGAVDGDVLSGADIAKPFALPALDATREAWIQFDFGHPVQERAVTLILLGGNGRRGAAVAAPLLELSTDGEHFQVVAAMPTDGAVEHTVSFPPSTARFFRMVFPPPPPPAPLPAGLPAGTVSPTAPAAYSIAKLVLHPDARVNRFEEKAGFAAVVDLYPFSTPAVEARDTIAKDSVIDLTSKMDASGRLVWMPPAGNWVVLRMGYSLLGITNHPASPEATGLEVDKLNAADVTAYFNHYLDNYQSAVGSLMGKHGLEYVITDSWEAGTQNWTDDMFAEFARRRGYDAHPWLPVLTGRVVGSAKASDQFLWDFRETIAEMVAENHYGVIASLLHARGMGQYGESHEQGRATIGDGMAMKRADDVPMAAMWTQLPGVNAEQYGYDADIRESASVAHIYGQNIVAAESLTARYGAWSWSPQTLKPTADKELAMGLNRFVIHTSVHQPLVDKVPGLGLGPYGQWFNRNETWAEEAQPWVSYLARSSYLLQQGKFVADVLYFYGEDSNLTAIFRDKLPSVPAGYNFDYINADALRRMVSVNDGRIVTASGMSYRVLALDPYSTHMSLPVLRAIKALVSQGAIVVGAAPVDTPSLEDDQAEFESIRAELWGSGAQDGRVTGKGRVYAGEPLTQSLQRVLERIHVPTDFDYTKPQADTNVLFVHRRLPDGDIYWVDSRNEHAQRIEATFRISGMAPELWHPETGTIEPASYRIEQGKTVVPLSLNPYATVFVVFRKPAAAESRTVPERIERQIATIGGTWKLKFEPNRGAPAEAEFNKLASWSTNADPGIKYFSGDATYTKTVQADADWFRDDAQILLDLGDVKNLATVRVNGRSMGILWNAPFRVDVTSALRPGPNLIEIKVTNLWVNRLIGDMQPGNAKQYTFTTQKFYTADSPLLPSGLLGPVTLLRSSLR